MPPGLGGSLPLAAGPGHLDVVGGKTGARPGLPTPPPLQGLEHTVPHLSAGGRPAGGPPAASPVPRGGRSELERPPGGGPPKLLDRFELLGLLGEGGMGRVFRARDRQIEGREVALKVLHPGYSRDQRFRDLFFQEIRAAQGFVSEHVVQVRDTGHMPDGSLFLTMDLVAGEPLSKRLAREGSLTPRHAIEIARQMLLGLHGGHDHGLVHRDIKPSNVMLAARVPKTEENPYGVDVRLLDFGIAGFAAEDRGGRRTGTPMYMSPEQAQAQRLDARSDLFGVGIVLYEMLAGGRPFGGRTLQQVTTSILETRIEPLIRELGHVPRALRKVLRKALRKDREKRFQSAGEFLAALERAKKALPDTGAGFVTKAALTLFVFGAAAEGAWIWKQSRELAAARTGAGEGSEELAALRIELSESEADMRRLQERLSEGGDLAARFEALERDYQQLNEANATLRRRNEDLQRRVADLNSAHFETLPVAKAAACFDEVLRRIEQGAGRAALDHLESQSRQGVFATEGLDGRAFVYELARAAATLDGARTEGRVDVTRVAQAERHLATVRAGEERFLVEAKGWMNVAGEDAEPVDRLGRLQQTVQQLEGSVAELRADGETSLASAWEDVLEGPADQDPSTAFAHASINGNAAILGLVERYAEHLENVAVEDGHLVLWRIEGSETLAAWGQWLGAAGANLEGQAADTIRAFHCAERWYAGHELDPPFAHLIARETALEEQGPHHDWKAQLALQMELARGSSYPPPPDSSCLMRHTWTESGSTMWFLERLQSRSSEGWNVERRIHDLEGNATGRPQTYTITRSGDTYYTAGIAGLDLRAHGEDVFVSNWTPEDPGEGLPDRPWARALDVEGYARRVSTDTLPCLVIRSGAMELWFSPRLGLVREIRDGVYEREQVFTSVR